jgi:release factor glutamine methyltransferase
MIDTPVRTIINEITTLLEPFYESNNHAQTVAWWLLEGITRKSKTRLIVDIFVTLSKEQSAQLTTWITLHTQSHYPLQYLLGFVPFGPLKILVEAPILIPRPETEEWCASLISYLEPVTKEKLRILDMCTGSGCIALWFAKSFPNAVVYGVDISNEALTLAHKNAAYNNITNVQFFKSDLFTILNQDTPFDLIVTNPPYISPDTWNDLSPTVAHWEDRGALVAGNQGMELIQKITFQAPFYLTKKSPLTLYGLPRLIMEIGYDQAQATRKLFIEAGFSTVKVLTDSAQRDRVVSGW